MRIKLPDWVDIFNPSTTGRDRNNNPVVTWPSNPSAREPALIEPLATDEYVNSQDTLVTRYKLMLHPRTAATSKSRVRWRGVLYEVAGDVQLTSTQAGKPDHNEAFLQRTS